MHDYIVVSRMEDHAATDNEYFEESVTDEDTDCEAPEKKDELAL